MSPGGSASETPTLEAVPAPDALVTVMSNLAASPTEIDEATGVFVTERSVPETTRNHVSFAFVPALPPLRAIEVNAFFGWSRISSKSDFPVLSITRRALVPDPGIAFVTLSTFVPSR